MLIYLIAPPGSLRHGFAVLLAALDSEQQISQFDTISGALAQESMTSPELIICDVATLDDGVMGELAKIHSRWLRARLVVMIDSGLSADQLGQPVDNAIVVTAGTAASRLRTLLKDLLREIRDSM